MTEKLIKLPFEEDHFLALWQYGSSEVAGKDVFLTHGTFSNKRVMMGIIDYLVGQGYTCWMLEWRDHGGSSSYPDKYNFETIALEDIKIALDYLYDVQGLDHIDCITHSGGGICLSMLLIQMPQYKSRIDSVIFFGCQAFGAVTNKRNYYKIKIGAFISSLLGFIPGQVAGSPENETYFMMKQWFRWNLTTDFKGDDGIDYKEKLSQIRIPILSVCGGGDLFIAPPSGCASFLESYDNPLNKLLTYSIANGNLEDYNHGRILHSSSAKKEIYPEVLTWLRK